MQPLTQRISKKRKKLLIYLLAGILIFIFIILPAAALTGLWVSVRQERAQRPPQVTVPNVIGQDYSQGKSLLGEKGLKMRVLATRSDQNQPIGIILDQSPLGGESVEVNHVVGVTIGGSPMPERMPPKR